MRARFVTMATFLALALAMVDASSADAQARSQRRIKRGGKEAPTVVDTTTKVDTAAARMRADSIARADSIRRAEELARRPKFYIGVGGGATFPMGDWKDAFETVGYNAMVPIGVEWPNRVFGLRADLSWNRLRGKDFTIPNPLGGTTTVSANDLDIYGAMADLTLNFPFGETKASSFYVLGGGGLNYLHPSGGGSSKSKGAVEGGAGFNFGSSLKVFLEGKYVYVFGTGDADNPTGKSGKLMYVPVSIGLRF